VRLTRLRLQNFRSYEELDLDLGAVTCAAIIGHNGAGKSTIPVAIEWALFGGGADEMVRMGTDRAAVTLDFELGGETWTINRGRDRGKKSWLVIEHGGMAMDLHTIAEAQAWVQRVIGFDQDAFRATVYAAQGQAGAFAVMKPTERKALLAGLLGLTDYEDWRETAAASARELHGQAGIKLGVIERLGAEVERHEPALRVDRGEVERGLELDRAALEALEGEMEAARAREYAVAQVRLRQQLIAQMDEVKAQGKDAKALEARREAALAAAESLAGSPHAVEALEAAYADYQARQADRQRDAAAAKAQIEAAEREADRLWRELNELSDAETATRRTLTAATRELEALDAPAAVCPSCGQTVDGEHRAQARARVEATLQAAQADLDEHGRRRNAIELQRMEAQHTTNDAGLLDTIAQAKADPFEDREALADARREAAALMQAQANLSALPEPADVDALRARWESLRDEAAALPAEVPAGDPPGMVQQRMATVTESIDTLTRRLEEQDRARQEVARIETEIAAEQREADALAERAQAYEVCARAFSRDGIPAMILDGAVGGIEAATNEVLATLGGTMTVQLVTQRAKKSGKGMTETLEILVDDAGFQRPLATFSGGEAYRVHVALRLGLGAVLAAGSGVDCDVLLIDEPTDLDSEGVQTLAELLPRTGRQVLLVTHEDELVDGLPQRILVDREAGAASVVEVG